MAEVGRDIGEEILEGIRQLKRGEHGRIVNVPAISSIRQKETGLSRCGSVPAGSVGSSDADPREPRRLT